MQEQIDDRDDPDGPDPDEAARIAWNNALWDGLGIAGVAVQASVLTELDHFRDGRGKPDNATDEPDPMPVDGWNGQSWSVTNSDNSTTTAVTYDNRGETPTPFNERWGSDAERQAGVYALNSRSSDHRTRIELSGLPTNPNHKGVVLGPVGGQRGTFDGVDGTFLGTGETGTEVKVNANGEPTWNGSDLKFKPDDNTATVIRPDGTYAGIGLWLTEAEDGSLTPEYESWISGNWRYEGARGNQYFREKWVLVGGSARQDWITTIPGTLTFKGPAVGHYSQRAADVTVGGAFVAEAEFVVDTQYDLGYRDRKGGRNNVGTLTGTIDNFVGLDGQPIGDGWKIEIADPLQSEFDPTEGHLLLRASHSGGTGLVHLDHHGINPWPSNARATFGDVVTFGYLNGVLRDDSRNDNLPGAIEGYFDIGEENHPVRMAGAYLAVVDVPDLPDN